MKKRESCKIDGFKYPAADKIGGRTSTICRSMACTLVRREACTPEEEKKWKKFFPEKLCAYCGAKATHLDHLYPLIKDREPTGYGTGPSNLVPCCGRCNQPKGNMNWKTFMRSENCQHVVERFNTREEAVNARIRKIEEFQRDMPAQKFEMSEDAKKKWNAMLAQFDDVLEKAEKELLKLKEELYK